MESISSQKTSAPTVRQLASLKIVSRLLAHELHSQATTKTVTMSKDEVIEIQTCIDLYIEEASRRTGSPTTQAVGSLGALEPQLVGARPN